MTTTRDDSWLRAKRYGEKWPRFAAEIPPELAAELDEHVRKVRLKHGSGFSRAETVRAGLRMYLDSQVPLPGDAEYESTAVEEPDEIPARVTP